VGHGTFAQIVKIAFLNDSIFDYASGAPFAVGGAERQQWFLARALAAAGWSVSVGVFGGIRAGETLSMEGVSFTGMSRPRTHTLEAWCRFLAVERPTWLYWRGANHLLGPSTAMARALGIRTIFSAAVDSDVIPKIALFQRPRWWRLYAWGLCWADRIFVQHGWQLSALAVKLRSKAFLVPSIAEEVSVARCHDERAPYLAWVGQLRQPKRPDLLIDMARQSADLRFVVCGGPSEFRTPPKYSEGVINALRSLPNVDYRGQVPPTEAQRVIAEAAALLSTSDEEGFPNTFLQAWSSGTPVVSL
jgi:glycosyltransferase involved in cell wall biosynthesis